MKRVLMFAAVASACCWAQPPQDCQPAPSNVGGALYPCIHADLRVAFRIVAPDSRKVLVSTNNADSGMGKVPIELARDPSGAWSVTVGPVVPGFHYYWYVLDGIEVSDPNSESYFGHNKELSGLEVPEKGTDFYDVKDVPHGDVRVHWYRSKTTGSWRRAYVYTPPDYDRSAGARYPVLYLQHGANENGSSWSRQGRAGLILDNLIAAGKAKPMVVAMETGYATPTAAPFGPAPAPAPAPPPAAANNPSAFERIVVDDLIPMVDSTYRTVADREHRAMAGLSMGGAQTLLIALSHLDMFSWIGCFSAPISNFDARTAYGGVFADAAAFNRKVHLFWIGAGTVETAMHNGALAMHEALDKAGVKNVFYESQGTAHEFQTWRRDLADFAPRLFQTPAPAPAAVLWKFDRIDEIGGHKTTVLGHPRVIDSPVGKAVQFNGVDDALFVDVHPLAGAETFTWEIVFRPDPGGAPEQRFFHLQEKDPQTGADTATRMLSEIRVVDGKWCLDSFAGAGDQSRALLDRERLHPLGVWHRVAMVYDGHELRNYVDGVLEGSGELHLIPQGPGHSSIGVRINKVNYFKGAVALARMTPAALSPAEFLKLPVRSGPR